MIPFSFDSVGITAALKYVNSKEKTCSSGSASRKRPVFSERRDSAGQVKEAAVDSLYLLIHG
jgi:hypothetical protein